VDRAVVELDALPDPDRPAADDDHAVDALVDDELAGRGVALQRSPVELGLTGGVVVRGLGRTRRHRCRLFVRPAGNVLLHGLDVDAAVEGRDVGVGVARGGRLCELAVLRGLRGVADALEPLEVPRLDPGQVLDVRDGVAAVERLEDRVRAVRRGAFEVLGLKGLVVDRGPIDGGVVLGGAERLQQALSSKFRPIAIASPVDFIAVPSSKSTSSNLSMGQRGTFVTT